jgi:hypothetical protein
VRAVDETARRHCQRSLIGKNRGKNKQLPNCPTGSTEPWLDLNIVTKKMAPNKNGTEGYSVPVWLGEGSKTGV